MKRLIDFRLYFIFSVLVLSACATTPKPLRESAELSAVQLAVLQTELQNYAKSANTDIKTRRETLIEQFKVLIRLERATKDTLYLELGQNKLSNELVILANRYQSREDDVEKLIKPESARLSDLTQPLQISSESFNKIQKALAELAKEETSEEQLAFIITYIQDVQKNIKEQKKSDSGGQDEKSANDETAEKNI